MEEEPATEAEPPTEDEVLVKILKNSMVRDDDPDNDYSPKTLVVKAGTTVTWLNEDRGIHTVTARDGGFNPETCERVSDGAIRFTNPASMNITVLRIRG